MALADLDDDGARGLGLLALAGVGRLICGSPAICDPGPAGQVVALRVGDTATCCCLPMVRRGEQP